MRRAATLLALLALAAAAGCGGEDEGLSTEDYVAEADAICAAANKKETALDPGGLGWHYGPKFGDAQFLSEFNDVGGAALRRLQALEPPEEDATTADEVIASIKRIASAFDDQIAALRAGDRAGESEIVNDYELAYTDLARAAAVLGLTQCQGLGV
jgi:hypothetical protein